MALRFLNSGYFAGKVGIGTVSPTEKLQVYEGGLTAYKSYTTTNAGAILTAYQSTFSPFTKTTDLVAGSDGTVPSEIRFLTRTSGTSTIDERVRITSTGKVGIGTPSPSVQLDIEDSSNVIVDMNTTTANANTTIRLQESGTVKATIGYDGTNDGLILTTGGFTAGNGIFIDDSQNVGIGTASPAAKLHIADSTLSLLKVQETSGNTGASAGALFKTSPNTGNSYFKGGILYEDTGNANVIGKLHLVNRVSADTTNAGVGDAKLTIDTNGNVGIGTTSPNGKLTTRSNGFGTAYNDYDAVYLDNTDITAGIGNYGNGIGFSRLGSTTYKKAAIIPVQGTADEDNLGLAFFTSPNSGFADVVEEAMRINYNGNVGIGDTPSFKLDVNVTSSRARFKATSGDANIELSSIAGHDWLIQSKSDSSLAIYDEDEASERMRINSSGEVLVGVTSNQTESKLTSRQNGSSIEFGHLNQSSGYYGTLGAMYSSGRPFLAFSCDSSPTSAGNNFATRGFKGNVIFSETNGNLKFAQATNANSTSQALTDRMVIKNDGAVQFNAYDSTNKTGTPTYLLGTDASGNVVKTLSTPGGDPGPYLPLAGGTMTGNVRLNDSVQLQLGSSNDAYIMHNGTNTYFVNSVGDLEITNDTNDGDIIFKSDDSAGGTTTYFQLDGGNVLNRFYKNVLFQDNVSAYFGGSFDLQIYHDGSNSYIKDNGTGTLNLQGSTQVLIGGTNGEVGVQYVENAGVGLRHNNVTKLTTESTGINVVGDIKIDSALLSNQENTDVDTGTETVANVAIATYTAAFFDFVIKKTTNVRSGTVYACHDGTNVEFTETSTQDLGDTSDVVLSVDISGANMRLLATVTSDDWSVKSLIRAI